MKQRYSFIYKCAMQANEKYGNLAEAEEQMFKAALTDAALEFTNNLVYFTTYEIKWAKRKLAQEQN